jgi:hypothetical protein
MIDSETTKATRADLVNIVDFLSAGSFAESATKPTAALFFYGHFLIREASAQGFYRLWFYEKKNNGRKTCTNPSGAQQTIAIIVCCINYTTDMAYLMHQS